METFNILFGAFLVIASLTIERIRWLYKFLLSAITAYYCTTWIFPNIHIWGPDEYTKQNIFAYLTEGVFLISLLLWGLNLLFFQWGLKWIMMRLFEKPISVSHKFFLSKLDEESSRILNAFLIRLCRKMIRTLRRYKIVEISGKEIDTTSITFRDFLDLSCAFLGISTQTLLCCVILGMGVEFIILLGLLGFVIIPLFIVCIFPVALAYLHQVLNIIRHEFDRPAH